MWRAFSCLLAVVRLAALWHSALQKAQLAVELRISADPIAVDPPEPYRTLLTRQLPCCRHDDRGIRASGPRECSANPEAAVRWIGYGTGNDRPGRRPAVAARLM